MAKKHRKVSEIIWEIDFLKMTLKPKDLMGIFDNIVIVQFQIESYYPKFTYN